MMDNIKTPEEWSIALYGEIYLSASNGIGGTQNKDGVGIPVSRIETIAEQRIDYTRVGYLSSFDEEKIKKHELHQDDILFSHINSPVHLGKTAIYDGVGKLYHGINLLRIVVDKTVFSSKLLNYHCKYTRALGFFSLNAQHAVNQSSLNQKKLSAFKIPLPPLAEQNEIADRLDTLQAQVEATQARLARIPDIIKKFRQSVLAAAVSGKLTEEWRKSKNISNWQEQKLGNIVKAIEAGKNLRCIETPPNADEYGIIKISAVTWGVYDEMQSKTLPSKELFLESRRIYSGDFLISRANTIELLGNPVIVQNATKNLMLSDKVLRLVMDEHEKPWVSIFLRSSKGRKEIEGRSTGNQLSMRNIGQKALLDIDIPKPSMEEQAEIVRRVEQLFTYADTIEQQANAAKERVDNLTQAILAKAFRGELTADWRAANPELISGDNSAAALLARIQAERATAKPHKRASKPAISPTSSGVTQ
ncbi:restriction endonuclease subunit S [Aeromonas hydrophila]|uniref:restriction endonuclease subunit S n=1 Tax=Aeromonas hydrophila TaxID=644 RepID=UPI00398A0D22